MNSKLLQLCLLIFTTAAFAQQFDPNDPRWIQRTVVIPSGVYVQLPQTFNPMPVTQVRVVNAPEGVLLVFPNILVLPTSGTSQSELYLAGCRGNQNFMFGSSNAVSSGINSGSYITTNGGVTWFGSNTINNGNTNNQRGDPGPIIRADARVIFTHLSSSSNFGAVTGMAAEYSTNFGQNFSASVQVVNDPNCDKNLTGTDDVSTSPYYLNTYFAWTSFGTSPANGRFSRTTNGGVSWSAPIVLNSTPANHNAQGHDVDVMPNGNVIVCWTAGIGAPPFTEDFVGVARSSNGGVSFSATENAYDVNGTRSLAFNGWAIRTNGFPRISIDKSGGTRNGWIYIVTDESGLPPAGSDADVILHRSTDGGVTWSGGIRVNQDLANVGHVQFFPAVRVDESGGVNVVYYDNRNFLPAGDSCSVFISRSTDGGNTWTDVEVADHHFRPKPVPGLAGGYMGDYIGITSGNGKVWGFWMDDKTPSGTFNAWAGYITIPVPAPAAPTLISPANNSTGVSLTPLLDWSDVPTAASYTVQVSTSPTFTTTVVNQSGLTSSQYTVPSGPLANNTLYYWRANATNSGGTSAWSAVWNFTTLVSAPAPPTLISPANNATGVSLTPLLDWSDVSGAATYAVQVSTSPTFTTTVVNQSGLTSSQYSVPASTLTNNTLYYWRANATNAGGTSAWSTVWNFTTVVAAPAPPTLISPANNATGVSLTPLLDWSDVSGATTYGVQVSTSPTFTTTVVNQSGLTSSQYTVPSGPLANNTLYYWRANATNASGTSAWSTVWNFTTVVAAPSAPILISPANNSTGQPLTPVLDWNDVSGATSYRAQVSLDSTFPSTVLDTTVSVSQVTVPSGRLANNTRYFWRVNASNAGGTSPWSAVWNFRTLMSGINIYSSEIPKEFRLYNNFPNPFNPATKIRFDIPSSSAVTLIIYDILGKEVASLIPPLGLPPGKYEVTWNADNNPSGIYIYRITAGDFTASFKMVLMK